MIRLCFGYWYISNMYYLGHSLSPVFLLTQRFLTSQQSVDRRPCARLSISPKLPWRFVCFAAENRLFCLITSLTFIARRLSRTVVFAGKSGRISACGDEPASLSAFRRKPVGGTAKGRGQGRHRTPHAERRERQRLSTERARMSAKRTLAFCLLAGLPSRAGERWSAKPVTALDARQDTQGGHEVRACR